MRPPPAPLRSYIGAAAAPALRPIGGWTRPSKPIATPAPAPTWTRDKQQALKLALSSFVANFSRKLGVSPEMIRDQSELILREWSDRD